MSGLNKIILTVGLAAAVYSAWGEYRQRLFPLPPLKAKPYVVVYGRDECGYCRALQAGLRARAVPFEWKRIEEERVMQELVPRMKDAGFEVAYFELPVVDVSGEIFLRPEVETVASRYGR